MIHAYFPGQYPKDNRTVTKATPISPTWGSVFNFAKAMEYKLSTKRHKGDRKRWLEGNIPQMKRYLIGELEELQEAIDLGLSSQEVLWEAADVANFAMMIADIYNEQQRKR